MYSVIFADDKKFIFTRQQILLIPYFNTLITSSSFLEKDIINFVNQYRLPSKRFTIVYI